MQLLLINNDELLINNDEQKKLNMMGKEMWRNHLKRLVKIVKTCWN
jgi:hypothetical protein